MSDIDATVADELPRNTRRRPWWSGRVEVAEIIDVGGVAARPRHNAPAVVAGVIGGNAQRRRMALPQPPRRERPPTLDAWGAGEQLYGQHGAPELTYRPRQVIAMSAVDTEGEKLVYSPPDGRVGRVMAHFQQPGPGAAGGTVQLVLVRGGVEHLLRTLSTAATLHSNVELVVESGDSLLYRVTAAGAAGTANTWGLTVLEER